MNLKEFWLNVCLQQHSAWKVKFVLDLLLLTLFYLEERPLMTSDIRGVQDSPQNRTL